MFTFIFINIKHTRYHLRVSSVTTGVIYLWEVSSNALIGSFAQAGDEAGVFPSPCSPGVCVCVGGVPPLAHLRRSSFNPALPGWVPSQSPRSSTNRPAEPKVQSQRPGAPGRVPESQRGTRHTHLTPLLPKPGNRGVRTGRPRDSAPVRLGYAEAHRGAARRHPESREGKPPRDRQSSGSQELWAHFGWHSSAPA